MNQLEQLIEMLDHYDIKTSSDAMEIRELVAIQNPQ